MSCGKAREVFEKSEAKIAEESDAKKQVIGPGEVWDVLRAAEAVHVASGQKTITFRPAEENRDELLKKATGRTGNLRAPTLKLGKEVYIGFNTAMYEKLGK